MSNKPRIPTDGAPTLTSNPFAALGGALGDQPAAASPSTEPSPAPTAAHASAPALHGKIVVRREKKGRGGKVVTVIEGLPTAALEDLARQLRRTLGCGAHVEGDAVVLAGAQSERARDWLTARGASHVVLGN